MDTIILLYSEDCLTCAVNMGGKLVEISEEMGELLEQQVDTQNEIKIPGFTQALVMCVIKSKEVQEERIRKMTVM